MPDSRSSSRGRRIGREGLLDAAAGLLTTIRLRDALSWVGVRAVAEQANVAPATLNHHFPSSGGKQGEPNAALARALITHLIALADSGTGDAARTVREGVAGMADHGPESLHQVAEVVAAEMLRASPPTDDAQAIAKLLAAAAARNDPDAAAPLKAYYDHVLEQFVEVYRYTLKATDRRMRSGLDLETLAVALIALDDGFTLRARFDPERATAERFSAAGVHLFEAFTARRSDPEDPDLQTSLLPLASHEPLDPATAQRIVDAAVKLYRGGGWAAVTVTSVAREAEVAQWTISAHYGNRNALASLVWSTFVPQLVTGLEVDAQLRVDRIVQRHCYRLADLTQHHRRLTAAMIAGTWNYALDHGPSSSTNSGDPRVTAKLSTLLIPVLERHAGSFRPGMVDQPELASEFAASLSSSALSVALTRPHRTAGEIADRITSTLLAGALIRRPRGV